MLALRKVKVMEFPLHNCQNLLRICDETHTYLRGTGAVVRITPQLEPNYPVHMSWFWREKLIKVIATDE